MSSDDVSSHMKRFDDEKTSGRVFCFESKRNNLE
jgi:hypothetical protein